MENSVAIKILSEKINNKSNNLKLKETNDFKLFLINEFDMSSDQIRKIADRVSRHLSDLSYELFQIIYNYQYELSENEKKEKGGKS